MDCKQYRSLIGEEALGTLRDERHAELHAHLALCAPCQAELDRVGQLLKAIDRGVADMVNIEPSPRLVAQLRQRLSEPVIAPRTLLGFWLPAAAGGLAIVSLLAVLLRPQTSQSPGANSRQPLPEIASMNPAAPPARPGTTPMPHASTDTASGAMKSRVFQSRVRFNEPRGAAPQQGLEVLVPPGEWQAVTRLANITASGQIDAGDFNGTIGASYDLPVVASIDLPLPKIDQIDVEQLPGVVEDR